MSSSAVSLRTFDLPAFGKVVMDGNGRVYRVRADGSQEILFYREADGQWNVVMSFPVIQDDLSKSLETIYRRMS